MAGSPGPCSGRPSLVVWCDRCEQPEHAHKTPHADRITRLGPSLRGPQGVREQAVQERRTVPGDNDADRLADPSTGGTGVPSESHTPGARRSLSKGRMEAFSDGVFAVAITLLVVDLAIHPPGSPLEQVLDAWPSYFAYFVSFLTIGAAWLGHTALTDRLKRVDPIFLRLNLLLLMMVTLLPFPTRLVADSLQNTQGERVFVTIYGLVLLAIRLLGFVLDAYARRERLSSQEGDQEGEEELDTRPPKTASGPDRVRDRDHRWAHLARIGGVFVCGACRVSRRAVPRGQTGDVPALTGALGPQPARVGRALPERVQTTPARPASRPATTGRGAAMQGRVRPSHALPSFRGPVRPPYPSTP